MYQRHGAACARATSIPPMEFELPDGTALALEDGARGGLPSAAFSHGQKARARRRDVLAGRPRDTLRTSAATRDPARSRPRPAC